MKRLCPVFKWLLLIWGFVSLTGCLVFGSILAWRLGPGNIDRNDTASPSDVRFVLNWCNLGDHRIQKVINSHVSAGSLCEHLEAYSMQIGHIYIWELIAPRDGFDKWYRGDQVSGVLSDAITFIGSWIPNQSVPWFPTEKEIRSEKYYIYPHSIYCYGVMPAAAELIFVRPSDNMVFYFDGKQ